MKHLKITLALFSVVLTTIIAFPAHAETEYFYCHVSIAKSERAFISAILPVEEGVVFYSFVAQGNFTAYVEDAYGVEVNALHPALCISAHSFASDYLRVSYSDTGDFYLDMLEYRLTIISESEWNNDS